MSPHERMMNMYKTRVLFQGSVTFNYCLSSIVISQSLTSCIYTQHDVRQDIDLCAKLISCTLNTQHDVRQDIDLCAKLISCALNTQHDVRQDIDLCAKQRMLTSGIKPHYKAYFELCFFLTTAC